MLSGVLTDAFGWRTVIACGAVVSALALFPLTIAVPLVSSVGSDWNVGKFRHTLWKKGVRLAYDPSGRPIKASDLTVGSVAHVIPDVPAEELTALVDRHGDERRTEIRHSEEDLDILDLIAPEEVVVTLSNSGYVKRQPVSAYRAQKRGGRGRSAAATKEEDFIDQLWLVNTHDTLDRKSVV